DKRSPGPNYDGVCQPLRPRADAPPHSPRTSATTIEPHQIPARRPRRRIHDAHRARAQARNQADLSGAELVLRLCRASRLADRAPCGRLESFGDRLGQGPARALVFGRGVRRDLSRSDPHPDLGGLRGIGGGWGLVGGLFARFFAAGGAVEMLVITMLYWKSGFSWLNRGYEYTLLWGLVCFAIALRGGGPSSVDRRIGVEL